MITILMQYNDDVYADDYVDDDNDLHLAMANNADSIADCDE